MSETKIKVISMNKSDVWVTKISDELLSSLKEYCHDEKDKPQWLKHIYDYKLAGQVKYGEQLKIYNSENYNCERPKCVKDLEGFVIDVCKGYHDNFINHVADDSHASVADAHKVIAANVNDMWINVMKEGDYNPIHNHNSASPRSFSFFVYIDIPERLSSNSRQIQERSANNPRLGRIADRQGWTHILFGSETVTTSQQMQNYIYPQQTVPDLVEGVLVIFPCWVPHFVNPFRGEGERISMAGNVNMWTKHEESILISYKKIIAAPTEKEGVENGQ